MWATSPKVRRFRFWWRLIIAYIKKYQFRFVALIFLLSISGFIIVKGWNLVVRSNVISIGYAGSYTIENIPSEILELATQSLVTTDEHGESIPKLASHWTVSEDGKTYIVFLKDNLIWHDSTLVDATNISLAISNVQITALNNKAIEFKLPSPIASFPQALNKPIFKTKTYYGTGEYRIVKIDQVEDSVKKVSLHPKDTNLPLVEIKFYKDQLQLVDALKIGEIKYAKIPNAQKFQSWPNLNVERQTDFSQIVTVFFNNKDSSLVSKDLRQALIFAINSSDFDGEVSKSPIPPQNWAYNDSVKQYSYNLVKAKELLSKLPPNDIKITLSVTPGLEFLADKIKSDWQSLGINVELEMILQTPKNYQALLAFNRINPDPDQYSLWHSTQLETNITGYQNVKVDKLLEDARTTTNLEERKKLYLEFQETLVEDAPAAFLYHPYRYKVVYKNIQDMVKKLPSL
ncbi:hypothetical protein A3A49_00175 [Candidatus Curtissbacteria bacterium RIFCSPLOWO2_01_FULL_38_11b]|uniref:Solute-binding protein family 5 domain-containing protein n=1 Tax=Candidatus Curtissbacteria bacterium RIFCSPLOWO2_01_FULL_38_11b TaxID=1797725 RepID=A0A1F5H3Z7_9BACT|nr:MAG: hypothetical protein A3A49_00175 [Candidatus Curtissbacteria bacterium RIFCSPLOWO2_01_FULL_38_11b]